MMLRHPLLNSIINYTPGGVIPVFIPVRDYQKRNIWMVDHSALLIAVFNGEPGGTLNTIQYAQQNQIEILYAE